jgi:hypothetical protein
MILATFLHDYLKIRTIWRKTLISVFFSILSCISATPIRGSTPSSVTVSSRWGRNKMRFPSWKCKNKYVIKSLTMCCLQVDRNHWILHYLQFLSDRVIIVTCEVFLNIRLYRMLMEDFPLDSPPVDSLLSVVCISSFFELSFSSTHEISSIFFPRRASMITCKFNN